MISYFRKVFIIYSRDLGDELRTFDSMLSTVVFGIILVFIVSFSFQMTDIDMHQAFPGVVWTSIFFSSVLAVQRLLEKERKNGALDGLLLASGDRGIVYLAKAMGNLTILLIFELIVIPVLWLFSDVPLIGVRMGLLLITLFLGSWGLAATATLLSGITMQLPGTRLLFPLLLFPLLIPLLIGSIECSKAAIFAYTADVSGWLYLLVIFDLLFTILPLVLFSFVLEG